MYDATIIIPCFNTEKYLQQCLASALSQEDVRLQIIFIDDCSTDGSLSLAADIASQHPDLIALSNPKNIGQARSRNRGLDIAEGRYIIFLDSDDYFASTTSVRDWIDHADKHSSEICVANYIVLREDGTFRQHELDGLDAVLDGNGNASQNPELANVRLGCQIMYCREFLDKHDIRFSTKLRQREDRVFSSSAMIRADRVSVTNVNAFVYRKHPTSTMTRVTRDQFELFSVHMEIVKANFDSAENDGYKLSNYMHVNGCIYWMNTFALWKNVIIEELEPATPKTVFDDLPEFVQRFLTALDNLTNQLPALYSNRHDRVVSNHVTLQKEATIDAARICLEVGRFDLLRQLLLRQRIKPHDAYDLIGVSKYPWAKDALCHYLRFNRNGFYSDLELNKPVEDVFASVDRVILHIGQPKTGSSAIQDYLEENRYDFALRGVMYPVTGVNRDHGERYMRSAGHAAFMRSILNSAEQPDLLETFKTHLAYEIENQPSKPHTIILSSESILSHLFTEYAFGGTISERISKITSSLGFKDIEVVAAFREQQSWLRSLYKEVISSMHNRMFTSPREFYAKVEGLRLLDYGYLQDEISKAPNVTATHFGDYSDLRKVGADRWFSDALGLPNDIATPAEGRDVNAAMSDAQAFAVMLAKTLRIDSAEKDRLLAHILKNQGLRKSPYKLFSDESDETLQGQAWFDAQMKKPSAPRIENLVEYSVLEAAAETPTVDSVQIERLKKQNADLRAAIQDIRNTLSWRITSPLRAVRRLPKSMRGR